MILAIRNHLSPLSLLPCLLPVIPSFFIPSVPLPPRLSFFISFKRVGCASLLDLLLVFGQRCCFPTRTRPYSSISLLWALCPTPSVAEGTWQTGSRKGVVWHFMVMGLRYFLCRPWHSSPGPVQVCSSRCPSPTRNVLRDPSGCLKPRIMPSPTDSVFSLAGTYL